MRRIWYGLGIALVLLVLLFPAADCFAARHAPRAETAAAAGARGKILFIPQDNRPTSGVQAAEVVRHLGYEVVMPDRDMLGGLGKDGDTEALWNWTQENARQADMAVIAADSLIYGGLVSSRKHEIPADVLQERADRLRQLHQAHPFLKLYAFVSLMRTPRSGEASGGEDPDYYIPYGEKIFRYTGLMDKAEETGLQPDEQQEAARLEQDIPMEVRKDWLERRRRNLEVTKRLMNFVREGSMDYLLVGKDDNASLSQTHRESRWLKKYGQDIPPDRFRMTAGIDEFALLLLTRAVNQRERTVPEVAVCYNEGKGGDTVPTYSDERLADTVKTDLEVAGARLQEEPSQADLILMVNTNPDGMTGEANHVRDWEAAPLNNGQDRSGTAPFLQLLHSYLQTGKPVAVADVAFTNGADNALMRHLEREGLLFQLQAYSGWNTATNSIGFALGQGILACRMKRDAADALLMTRYLDDWGYQSNVRTTMAIRIEQMDDPQIYLYLGGYEQAFSEEASQLLARFARLHLPRLERPDRLSVTFPWHRLFIAEIGLSREAAGAERQKNVQEGRDER